MCRATFDRKIELVLSTLGDVPPVLGHASHLEQVILNICLNARDVLEDAQVDAPRIEVAIAALPGDRVRLRISDNGPGMREDVRVRVFEPFFTTKPLGRGTGLGLASAYAIVADHRGRITCESAPGRGTRFEIELPTTHERIASEPARTLESGPVPTTGGGHERLLLADDEPIVRRVLAMLLESAGYEVEQVSDGAEAIERLSAADARFALALIDRSMPRMSGEQVVAKLAELRPELPVVLLSGNPGDVTPRGQLRAVLPKPVDEVALLEAVRHAIDGEATARNGRRQLLRGIG
jgi:CheY-like chemotaxis protein